jgi:hypothetical protein
MQALSRRRPSAAQDSMGTSMTATRALLACGIIAGPLYVVVGLVQILIRPGFDLTRHELSLMSIGDLGWIQITNFVVSGLLVIAGAAGMHKVLAPGRGATWGPLLVGIYGLGLIGAGFFVADPMNGFPAGTPAGNPNSISWHALMHLISAAVGFAGLIAACFVMARRFASARQGGWATYSLATGVFFMAGFAGIASGSRLAAINVGFGIAVLLGWAWVSAMAARLMIQLPGRNR